MLHFSQVGKVKGKPKLKDDVSENITNDLNNCVGNEVAILIIDLGNKTLRDNLRNFLFGVLYKECIECLIVNGAWDRHIDDVDWFHDNWAKQISGVKSISKALGTTKNMLLILNSLHSVFLTQYDYQLSYPTNKELYRKGKND